MSQSSKWFESSINYEIYVQSFKDSNNDGIGDLNGITSKLQYLKDLGINAIWVTPIYESPKVDNGYDIANYYEIDEQYGTLNDFKNLIKKAHELNIKIILDIVLNHTSNKHKWFIENKDYYIWTNEPNNFTSYFAGSAWEKQDDKYYYHAFSKEQPDLNWTNEALFQEFQNIFNFWMDLGVDGFRLDVINFLKSDLSNFSKNENKLHELDHDLENIFLLINKITTPLKSKNKNLFLIGEVGSENIEILAKYVKKTNLDVVFNFNIGSLKKIDATIITEELNKTYEYLDFPTLFFSSHDTKRALSRLCSNDLKKNRLLLAIILLAKGSPFIYYGEEIGLEDLSIQDENDLYDISAKNHFLVHGNFLEAQEKSRDFSRGIMHFENDVFSLQKPWLPLDANFNLNELKFYQKMIKLRDDVFKYGSISKIINQDDVLFFTRSFENKTYEVILNFSNKEYVFKKDSKIIFKENTNMTIKPNGFIVIER